MEQIVNCTRHHHLFLFASGGALVNSLTLVISRKQPNTRLLATTCRRTLRLASDTAAMLKFIDWSHGILVRFWATHLVASVTWLSFVNGLEAIMTIISHSGVSLNPLSGVEIVLMQLFYLATSAALAPLSTLGITITASELACCSTSRLTIFHVRPTQDHSLVAYERRIGRQLRREALRH